MVIGIEMFGPGRIRAHILGTKKIEADTGWRRDSIPPRHGPHAVTRPCPSGWEWRSLALSSGDGKRYRLLFQVEPRRGKWKAALMYLPDGATGVVILRIEDQPGTHGGGLHIHANCGRSPDLAGAESMDMAYILPEHGCRRRRRVGWTKSLFCQVAGRMLRTHPMEGQEEMPL